MWTKSAIRKLHIKFSLNVHFFQRNLSWLFLFYPINYKCSLIIELKNYLVFYFTVYSNVNSNIISIYYLYLDIFFMYIKYNAIYKYTLSDKRKNKVYYTYISKTYNYQSSFDFSFNLIIKYGKQEFTIMLVLQIVYVLIFFIKYIKY